MKHNLDITRDHVKLTMKKVPRYSRLKQNKVYLVGIFCVIVIIFCVFFKSSSRHSVTLNEAKEVIMKKSIGFKGEKIVHLDLKGAPPKISYYKYLFPLLTKLGATGILMEYEDMFPYSGELINISALNSYSIKDIKTINRIAKEENLKIIPLIPTLGHLEFLLKLRLFMDYREIPEYPQMICPTNERTEIIMEAMITQIVIAHPNSDYIHLGANEVHYLGVCERCNDFLLNNNLSKSQLFIKYMNSIISLVRKVNPNLRILIWDDQLRALKEEDLKIDNFHQNIEPVIWKYSRDVYDDLGPSLWNNYRTAFKNVWIASAFKGATGTNEIVSYVTHYMENHRSWISVVSEYEDQFEFQGIIITGWQRYDHFSILCELLPVGIPTLAMCLRLLLGFNDSPLSPPKEIAKVLECEHPYALIGPVFGSPKCGFLGGNILEQIIHFQHLRQEFEKIIEDSIYKGWLSDYNVAKCFSNTYHVELVTSSLSRIREDLSEIKTDITLALQEVYDRHTVEEWLQTYLDPFERQVEILWNTRNTLLNQRSWNRRPLKGNNCDL